MKCIPVCEPFASALIYGDKDPENRKRALPIFGATIIHAGLSTAWFTRELCEWLHERWPECPASPLLALHHFKHRMGKAIGACDFGEPYAFNQSDPKAARRTKWETGPHCHPVMARVPFSNPFPIRGQQGAFTIPWDAIPADCQASIEALPNHLR